MTGSIEDDKFGDWVKDFRLLAPIQQWNRALLQMRFRELEWEAAEHMPTKRAGAKYDPKDQSTWPRPLLEFQRDGKTIKCRETLEARGKKQPYARWTAGLMMYHQAAFKEPISDKLLAESRAYITTHPNPIDMGALLEIEKEFYGPGDGTHGTWALREQRFDELGGK